MQLVLQNPVYVRRHLLGLLETAQLSCRRDNSFAPRGAAVVTTSQYVLPMDLFGCPLHMYNGKKSCSKPQNS